jgi:hypothetical protein
MDANVQKMDNNSLFFSLIISSSFFHFIQYIEIITYSRSRNSWHGPCPSLSV